jgi:hypothetical protein
MSQLVASLKSEVSVIKLPCVLFLLELEINSLKHTASKLTIVQLPLAHSVSVMSTAGVQDRDHNKIIRKLSTMYMSVIQRSTWHYCFASTATHGLPTSITESAYWQLSTSVWILQCNFPTVRSYQSTEKFTAFRILYLLLPVSLSLVRIALTRSRLLSHCGYHPKHQDCQHFIQWIHKTSLHPLGNCCSCMWKPKFL